MQKFIVSSPISSSEFLPFGSLLESPKTGVRENFVANVFNGRNSARANLALVREQPAADRFIATTLERHSYSTQAFFPLSGQRYLSVVCGAHPNGDPDLDTLRAFECRSDQAVSYSEGTWHMGIKTLDIQGVFAVLVHEDGSPADCEFREVDPFEVRIGGK
jgi:ureidoglycolate lyase